MQEINLINYHSCTPEIEEEEERTALAAGGSFDRPTYSHVNLKRSRAPVLVQ